MNPVPMTAAPMSANLLIQLPDGGLPRGNRLSRRSRALDAMRAGDRAASIGDGRVAGASRPGRL